MKRIGLSACGVMVVLCGLYSFCIETNWIEVTRHDLRRDPGVDGLRIVQISDLHLQAVGAHERAVARLAIAERPDVVILSGDVIDRAEMLPALEGFLSELGSVPVVAVLGNWEHWSDVDLTALKAVYERREDTHLLVNKWVTIPKRMRTVNILGLDDFTAGKPDVPNARDASTADARIVIQHSPGFFAGEASRASLSHVDLCLAGHTHGGQVALFGHAPWRPRGSGPFTSGFYATQVCRLYVSRGVGTSVLPLRFGARPEIAVFVI